MNSDSNSKGNTITVRQMIDPYADDIQYVASREVTLEPDGRLCLSTIGLGNPGDDFVIMSREERPTLPLVTLYMPISGKLSVFEIKMMATYEDGPNPILTIVESGDDTSAYERHRQRRDAREREQQIAYLKGLVTGAWNWVFPPMPSDPVMSMASQHLDSNPITPCDLDSVSTGVTDMPKMSRLVHRRTGDGGEPV